MLCIYQESTSDVSVASLVTAMSGSPPRSRRAYSDEDDQCIQSWAEDVATFDSDGLDIVRPYNFRMPVIVVYLFICPGAYKEAAHGSRTAFLL
jgi:hypothetical protein